MKIISINGITKTGKTTTCEALIRELSKRGYRVGSIKEIHNEAFAIDTKGSNTDRHKEAGSMMVVARGLFETDILIPKALDIETIFDYFDTDWLICEGVEDANIPKIVTGITSFDLDGKWDDRVLAISGRFSNLHVESYRDKPVFHYEKDITNFVDLLEKHVMHRLPNMDPACCDACGSNCKELMIERMNHPDSKRFCVLTNQDVECFINGKSITMVPFVQKLLKNAVLGVASELDGYKHEHEIVVRIKKP